MVWIQCEATRLTVLVYWPQHSLPEGQTWIWPVYQTPKAAQSITLREAQRKWMIRANSLVKVCKRVFGTSFISCQETSDSCLQWRNKELKLHAGEGPLGSGGQEKGSLWNIEGDWRWGQSTSALPPQLLHQPTMCVLWRETHSPAS